MATDPMIRNLFRAAGDDAPGAIDPKAVIRRARARRLPRQIGAGGVFTLAIGGLGVLGVQGVTALNQQGASTTTAADSGVDTFSESEPGGGAGSAGGSAEGGGADGGSAGGTTQGDLDEGAIKRAPAERINLCGGTVAEVAPSQTGLELTTDFPDAEAGTDSVTGTVTLTNTGTETLVGYTAASPAITLARDGIVVWHSNGPSIAMAAEVNLAPGESLDYTATFTPVVCGVEDDLIEGFPEGLPAAEPGEYEVSALIDFMGDSDAELVTGPAQAITLR